MLSFKVMAVHQSLNVKKNRSPDPLPDFLGHYQNCEPSEGQEVITLPTKPKKNKEILEMNAQVHARRKPRPNISTLRAL